VNVILEAMCLTIWTL